MSVTDYSPTKDEDDAMCDAINHIKYVAGTMGGTYHKRLLAGMKAIRKDNAGHVDVRVHTLLAWNLGRQEGDTLTVAKMDYLINEAWHAVIIVAAACYSTKKPYSLDDYKVTSGIIAMEAVKDRRHAAIMAS